MNQEKWPKFRKVTPLLIDPPPPPKSAANE
jgi:hypothetical protein